MSILILILVALIFKPLISIILDMLGYIVQIILNLFK